MTFTPKRSPRLVLSTPWVPLFGFLLPALAHSALPPEVRLADLFIDNGGDGSVGSVVLGDITFGELATRSTVAPLGDVNNDGIDDFIIGASLGTRTGAYIVFGQSGGYPPELSAGDLLPPVNDGSLGFVITESVATDSLGRPVLGLDLNGDGIGDIAVVAYRAGPTQDGRLFVLFGRDGPGGDRFPPLVTADDLLAENGGDGTRGVVFSGYDQVLSRGALATGDLNGDGIDDLVIDGLFVVYGRDRQSGSEFPAEFSVTRLFPEQGGDGTEGFVLTPPFGETFGLDNTVSASGDYNHDGIDDLLIGSPFGTPFNRQGAGWVYLVYGRGGDDPPFPPNFNVGSLFVVAGGDGSEGAVFIGADADDGTSIVSAVGDVNGDGIDDFIVGAERGAIGRETPGSGEAYVVYGRDVAAGDGFEAETNLQTIRLPGPGGQRRGFSIVGISAGDLAGIASRAGDVNGDGIDDISLGSETAANVGAGGEVYLLYGRDTARDGEFPRILRTRELTVAGGGDGSLGVVFGALRAGDEAGYSVGIGDVNDDGIEDFAIAAPGLDSVSPFQQQIGAVFVIYGDATEARR